MSTYRQISKTLINVVHRHWHISSCDPNIGHVFRAPPCACYKTAPNLRDQLVWSYFHLSTPSPFPFKIPHKNFLCFNCVTCNSYRCNSMFTEKTVTHPKTNRTYKVKGRITCLSTFVAYLFICASIYVGKKKVGQMCNQKKIWKAVSHKTFQSCEPSCQCSWDWKWSIGLWEGETVRTASYRGRPGIFSV